MQEIADYYNERPDDGRLRAGWGLLEFERTKELISRHLPPAPARILDVGGGSGIYGEWLGALGYEVHLIDLAPAHIERARRDSPGLASAEVGDARKLDHAGRIGGCGVAVGAALSFDGARGSFIGAR